MRVVPSLHETTILGEVPRGHLRASTCGYPASCATVLTSYRCFGVSHSQDRHTGGADAPGSAPGPSTVRLLRERRQVLGIPRLGIVLRLAAGARRPHPIHPTVPVAGGWAVPVGETFAATPVPRRNRHHLRSPARYSSAQPGSSASSRSSAYSSTLSWTHPSCDRFHSIPNLSSTETGVIPGESREIGSRPGVRQLGDWHGKRT